MNQCLKENVCIGNNEWHGRFYELVIVILIYVNKTGLRNNGNESKAVGVSDGVGGDDYGAVVMIDIDGRDSCGACVLGGCIC